MAQNQRIAFIISDGTGITAETLGHSLLSQFEGIHFVQKVMPFIDSVDKAERCLAEIQDTAHREGSRPILFTTLINPDVRSVLERSRLLVLDFFARFLDPLQAELGIQSSHTIGRSHAAADRQEYRDRIDAINFALANDDGVPNQELNKADVILIGVSRSGKTPTCLYLALQFGVKAANYPLIPDDFQRDTLPKPVLPHRNKLFGLTIGAERLSEIRNERRPGSQYASIDNCRREVSDAECLMGRYGIPSLNSTTRSIEEIATKILQESRIERRVF
ncbi:MAG: kinase/pyrophosphorylase [Betaproteobacteria bacterium]|nr:kinase/pyrophosphorylase [Betaproteobacteria bacterium]